MILIFALIILLLVLAGVTYIYRKDLKKHLKKLFAVAVTGVMIIGGGYIILQGDMPSGDIYTFGQTECSTSNNIYVGVTNREYMWATSFTSDADHGGNADNISVKMYTIGQTMNIQCAIYEYDGANNMGNLTGVTEVVEVTSADDGNWVVFPFTIKPAITANTTYFLAVKPDGDYTGGGNVLTTYYTNSGGDSAYMYSASGVTFPDEMTGETAHARIITIVCSYSEAGEENNVPTASSPSPSNATTNQSLSPMLVMTANDLDGDTMVVDWYYSINGVDYTHFGHNSTGNDTIRQPSSGFATDYGQTYYWKVAMNDSTVNISYIFHFKTRPDITITQSSTPVLFDSGGELTIYNVSGDGQSDGTAAVEITNNGSTPIDIQVRLNTTIGNDIHLKYNIVYGNVSHGEDEHNNWDEFRYNQSNWGFCSEETQDIDIENDLLYVLNCSGTSDQWGNPAIHNGILYTQGKDYDSGDTYDGYEYTVAWHLSNGTKKWETFTGSDDDPLFYYDGKIYTYVHNWTSTENIFFCLDADDGSVLWHKDINAADSTEPAFGTESAPDYETDTIIAHGCNNSDGANYWNVWCWYADNGTTIWQHSYTESSLSSPLITDDYVYVFCKTASSQGGIHCFWKTNGTIKWQVEDDERYTAYDTAPLIIGDYMYIPTYAGDFNITKVNKDTGALVSTEYINASEPGDSVYSLTYNPTTGFLYAGTNYKLYCINPSDLSVEWEFDPGGAADKIYSHAAHTGYYMYFGSVNNHLYCLNASTGAKIYDETVNDTITGGPVISDGLLAVYIDNWYCNVYGDLDTYENSVGYTCDYEIDTDYILVNTSLATDDTFELYLYADFDGTIAELDISRYLNISYNDSSDTQVENGTLRFVTSETLPSYLEVSNPIPANNSNADKATLTELTIDIIGDGSYDWNITCSNGDTNHSEGDSSGTKDLQIVEAIVEGVAYTWWVNVTDGINTVNNTYYFSIIRSTQVRSNGVDYFIWLGDNTTIAGVAENLSGYTFDGLDALSILGNDGNWDSESATVVSTFMIVKSSLVDDTGLVTVNMSPNSDYTDAYENRTFILTYVATQGVNYTGFTNGDGSTLGTEADKADFLDAGEVISVWDDTNYKWIAHLQGTTINENQAIDLWDVCYTRIYDTETWNQVGV